MHLILYRYFRIRRFFIPYSLVILWIIIQALLYINNGIVTKLEAIKYISQANVFLETGSFTTGNYWLYSTLILLIAFCIHLKLSFAFIVAIQLILNFVSLLMFYNLSFHFLRNRKLAWFSGLFFICNVFYQWYNSYLFTESLFFSLTVIYSSYLLTLKRLQLKNIVVLILFLALLSVTRPTGILFLIPTILYIYLRFMHPLGRLVKITFVGIWLGLFIFLLNAFMQSGGSLNFMKPYLQENIICGVNTVSEAPIILPENGNSLPGLFRYIYYNNPQFLKLGALKSGAFWGLLRSYYSNFHNAALVLMFYPFYILGIAGIIKKWKAGDVRIVYILTIIIFFWLTTVLTCDDWHNRFFLTITPFLFLLGIGAFMKKRLRTK